MEIERKFLVKALPTGWRTAPRSRIRQGYFPLDDKGMAIRVRDKDSRYFITIKAGQGSSRLEQEIRISPHCFKTLWPLVREASVVKTRWKINFAGCTIELDMFEGRHRGLKIAEVEFSSQRQAKAFQPPPWFGREVTGNHRYNNASLARRRRL